MPEVRQQQVEARLAQRLVQGLGRVQVPHLGLHAGHRGLHQPPKEAVPALVAHDPGAGRVQIDRVVDDGAAEPQRAQGHRLAVDDDAVPDHVDDPFFVVGEVQFWQVSADVLAVDHQRHRTGPRQVPQQLGLLGSAEGVEGLPDHAPAEALPDVHEDPLGARAGFATDGEGVGEVVAGPRSLHPHPARSQADGAEQPLRQVLEHPRSVLVAPAEDVIEEEVQLLGGGGRAVPTDLQVVAVVAHLDAGGPRADRGRDQLQHVAMRVLQLEARQLVHGPPPVELEGARRQDLGALELFVPKAHDSLSQRRKATSRKGAASRPTASHRR